MCPKTVGEDSPATQEPVEAYWYLDFQMIITFGKLCPQVTFAGKSFQNQKAYTDFLEDIYAWSGMNFIWTRDMLMCTKQRITQDFVSRKPIKARVIWGEATCVQGERSMICAKF